MQQHNSVLVEQAVAKWISTKVTIKMLEARLEELRPVIEAAAEFKPGCNTGHLQAAGAKVTVTIKNTETWDQERLNQIRDTIGAERFYSVFKVEHKPQSKKIVDAFTADPEMKAAIDWARVVKPAKATITYEDTTSFPDDGAKEAE